MSSRLLLVTPYGTTAGGAEQWILGILRDGTLQRAGWQIDAVVMQEGPMRDALRETGATAVTVPVPASPIGIVRRSASLRRAISMRQPDVVMGNGVKAQLAVTMALAGRRTPTVWVKHDHSYDRLLACLLGAKATVVVATASEVGLPARRSDLEVVEPPRPPDPLPEPTARAVLEDHGWTSSRDALTVAMITRLVPYKGVDLAVAALADPRTRRWHLLVIGDDDPATPGESERLRRLAEQCGVAQRVCLAGPVAQAGRLLSAVDAVAVLTRPGEAGSPSKEGYGIVASEAMLAGVPVIVAQTGPISRRLLTRKGPADITLSAPDSAHVASALATLTDESTRRAMGSRGAATARVLPSQAEVSSQLLQVLDRARG